MARTLQYQGHSSTTRNYHSLRTLAEDVAIERGVCAAEAFFHMAAVRSLHPEMRAAVVTCQRALVQEQQASGGNQAAHLMPGQILVHGRPIWVFAQNARLAHGLTASHVTRVSLSLQRCFAKTNSIPAHFNRADSQAEIMAAGGLKLLLANAVQRLWNGARVDPEGPLMIDRANVIRALGHWFTTINGIYRLAELQKRAAAAAAQSPAERQARTDEADVLSAYADSFLVSAEPTRFVREHLGWLQTTYGWM